VESALSPREIQARLRAGATAEEVAKAAGIPVGRVQRYETPILAERARVVSEARSASAPGPHRQTPGRPLGALVDDRLQQEDADPESVEWEAKRRPDGTWLVTLSMTARGPVRASWTWDPSARRVRPADAGANAILAPMPAPSEGPDSLTALAEATGVAQEQLARHEPEALAVGDDAGRRRGPGPSRTAGGRSSGLVVLAGRGAGDDEDNVTRPTGTGTTERPSPAAASASASADVLPGSSAGTSTRLDPGVPGGGMPAGGVPGGSVPGGSVPGGSVPGGSVPGGSVPGGAPAARAATPASDPRTAPRGPRLDESALLPGTEPTHPIEREDRALFEDAPAAGKPTGGPNEQDTRAVSAESTPAERAATGGDPVREETEATPPPAAVAPKAARPSSGRRRSAVPAWDDIMFGARRG
jgi:hypothetical protein